MTSAFTLFVGIDWGSESHHICGVDTAGKRMFKEEVNHTGEAIEAFAARLLARAPAEEIAVAMETPRGAILEVLAERGVACFAINPKQLDRFRDRHSVGGAKDDTLDAFVAADSLRTDMKLFRRVELGDPMFVELREMARAHDSLVADVLIQANRLREQLRRYYPQFLQLGDLHDQPWLWELLTVAPTPARAVHLKRPKVKAILKKHRIRRIDADNVLAKLREKPLPVAPGVANAASAHVGMILPLLRTAHEQRKACDTRVEVLMNQLALPETASPAPEGAADSDVRKPEKKYRDAAILLSVRGLGAQTGATILTEASTAIRDRDYRILRVQTGVAPVRRQTGIQGKRRLAPVHMRRACNPRLRNAVHHWASVSTQHEPRSRAHYAALRQRGHSHNRALRSVADRLLAMLIAMLKSGSLYESARRTSA